VFAGYAPETYLENVSGADPMLIGPCAGQAGARAGAAGCFAETLIPPQFSSMNSHRFQGFVQE
jgi:hypothetical protein